MLRKISAQVIRMVVAPLARRVYRIRAVHPERVPATGGALLLPNHVTYIDAILLYCGCPRPVRFVMDEVFARHPVIRLLTSMFDTVNIRKDSPIDAIRVVLKGLANGEIICLFAEGQLTRTGTLCELQKGFELIARKAKTPLIPVWIDGAWGSVFSFERNRFFWKKPRGSGRGVTVAYGEPLDPAQSNASSLTAALQAASVLAVSSRKNDRTLRRKIPGKDMVASAFRALDPPSRRRMWLNGHQIGMVNAIPRKETIHCIGNDPCVTRFLGLFAAFPALYGGKLVIHDWFDGDHAGIWIGGDRLRGAIQSSQINHEIDFYDLDVASAAQPLDRGNIRHFPCLACEDVIVAMSMPHPPPSSVTSLPVQKGHCFRTWGRLLPGWKVRDTGSELIAVGPVASEERMVLPAGTISPEGVFLSPPAPRKSRSGM
ncbi:MAG: 1-acyl-sn-glycerol-3-phosphate acyltransferase [Verrucomicrobiota bacterium]